MPTLMATLGLNMSSFIANLNKAAVDARTIGNEIGASLGEHITGKLTDLASAAAMWELTKSTVEYGEEVSVLAQRLGISTDAVQAWDFALRHNGTSIQENAIFFERLAMSRKHALEGNAEAINSFKNLGISIDDLNHKRLEDLALQIAQAFEAGDPQKLIADLRDVGGKGAGALVAAFRTGLADLINEAKDAGVVMGNEVVEGLRDAAERSKDVWMEFRAGIAPVIDWLAIALQHIWRWNQTQVDSAVGWITGGYSGSKAAIADLKARWAEEDRLAEERKNKRKQSFTGGAEGDGETKEQHRAEEAAARKILQLKEELYKLQEENDLKSLSKEEQVQELYRRRAAILEAMAKTESEQGRLQAAIDVEKIDQQLRGYKDQKDKASKEIAHLVDVNSLQKIGAYTRDNSHSLLTSVQKIEGHVAHLRHRPAAPSERIGGFGS